MVWITHVFSSFLIDGSSSFDKSGEAISDMGCMIPQSFAARGNDHI
jgi:hypothetical protein